MTPNLAPYSVRVTPQSDLQSKYSAHILVKEMQHGLVSGLELQHRSHMAGFIPMLMRLGMTGSDIGHIMARFERDRIITITTNLDPEALRHEGFE